jgi:hypothetical protein
MKERKNHTLRRQHSVGRERERRPREKERARERTKRGTGEREKERDSYVQERQRESGDPKNYRCLAAPIQRRKMLGKKWKEKNG